MYFLDPDNRNTVYRCEKSECSRLVPEDGSWQPAVLPEGLKELSEAEVNMYVTALETARKAHRGQTDKAGADYILHPVTVSALTEGSFTAVTAALLHDTVEDTYITLDDLRELGMSEDVVRCVDALTHRPGEARKDYIERIAGNYDAVCVKLADLTHNSDLSRIPDPQPKDFERLEKYKKEKAYLTSVREALEKENGNA